MKKLTLLLMGCFVILLSAKAQKTDTIEEPQEKIIVNKEFDEKGNLITYDSTYINSWSGDTSFQFNNQFFRGEDFANIDKFLNDFFNDSTHQNLGFSHGFGSSFFDDEFFKKFAPMVPDSMFSQNFPFLNDSAFHLQNEFGFHDLDEIQKQMQKHFQQFQFQGPARRDLNEKQKKELKALQDKHKKEMEELMKKWEDGGN